MQVDIIIPTIPSRKHYLNRLLMSLDNMNQSNNIVFNPIIVDSGSSAGKQRNIGLERSTGDYFYFVDDDDLIYPNFIQNLYPQLEAGHPAIFFSSERFYQDEDINLWKLKKDTFHWNLKNSFGSFLAMKNVLDRGENTHPVGCYILRKDLKDIKWEESPIFGEDIIYNKNVINRLVEIVAPFIYLNEFKHAVVLHNKSTMFRGSMDWWRQHQIPDLHNKVSIVIVNYNTVDCTKKLIDSILEIYNDITIHIIEGSDKPNRIDEQNKFYKNLPKNIIIHRIPYNIHHGPGIDFGIKKATTPYVLVLDSDTYFIKPGIIELMLNPIDNKPVYGSGFVCTVNRDGYDWVDPNALKYLHPFCMLINKGLYNNYPKPIKHGAPMIEHSIFINENNLLDKVVHIQELWDYIVHTGAETVKESGWNYNLG